MTAGWCLKRGNMVETVPIFGSELDLKSSCKIDQLAQLTWNSPTCATWFSLWNRLNAPLPCFSGHLDACQGYKTAFNDLNTRKIRCYRSHVRVLSRLRMQRIDLNGMQTRATWNSWSINLCNLTWLILQLAQLDLFRKIHIFRLRKLRKLTVFHVKLRKFGKLRKLLSQPCTKSGQKSGIPKCQTPFRTSENVV